MPASTTLTKLCDLVIIFFKSEILKMSPISNPISHGEGRGDQNGVCPLLPDIYINLHFNNFFVIFADLKIIIYNNIHMNRLKRITQQNQRKRMFSDVTDKIQNQGGLKVNPETGVRYEEPLEEKHPAMDVALAVAQPGTIVEKALAPMVYKSILNSATNGDLSEALIYGLAPGSKEWEVLTKRQAE